MKKISIALAAIAVIASSCRNDETVDLINQVNANTVGFTSATSRADLTDLSDLMGDEDGFMVYATSGTEPTSWMDLIDGSNNYAYSDDSWSWVVEDVSWPTDDDSYPINFYAFYASDYSNMDMSVSEPTAVTATYSPSTDIAEQVDILATSATADSRPAGDKVTLYFGHILSRVNFTTTAGYESTVHLQSVGLNNALDKKDYDFVGGTWSDASDAGSESFAYLSTTTPATSFEGEDASESSSAAVSSTAGYLMMLPQETTSWDPETDESVVNAHIEVIYRVSTDADANTIGYTDASDHPDYDPETDSAYDGTPLFVKVGYPFSDLTLILESGKAYNYDLHIATDGATNGYLADEYYYDENGNPTEFLVENKDVGDPISDGTIDFIVKVEDWDESDVSVL